MGIGLLLCNDSGQLKYLESLGPPIALNNLTRSKPWCLWDSLSSTTSAHKAHQELGRLPLWPWKMPLPDFRNSFVFCSSLSLSLSLCA